MKKLQNIVSPFIMLLIPVFLGMAILLWNSNGNETAGRYRPTELFKMPSLKVIINAMI